MCDEILNHKEKINLTFRKMNSNINSLDLPVEKMDKLFEQLSSATSKKAKEQIAKDISAKTGHQFSIANRYFEKNRNETEAYQHNDRTDNPLLG